MPKPGRPIPKLNNVQLSNFEKKIIKSDKCWIWSACKDQFGYGSFLLGRRHFLAHRISYTVAKGQIPHGLVLDHICRNTSCVNPEHLRAVTHKFNIAVGMSPFGGGLGKRSACAKGHPYRTGSFRLAKNGSRVCKICMTEWGRASKLRQKQRRVMKMQLESVTERKAG